MATPKQTDPQFKLRFTAALRDTIEAAAKANNRSMNAEIVDRLEAYDALHARLANVIGERDRLEQECEYYRVELKELAGAHNKGADLDKKRMLLEAERQRNETQKAALEETKEYVEREMRHLMQAHEHNNAQLALLEKLRGEVAHLTEERQAARLEMELLQDVLNRLSAIDRKLGE